MYTFNEYVADTNVKFCEDRKKGASKIAHEAQSKGGISMLTAWHFAAKLPEYDNCIKAIKENKPTSYFHQQQIKFIQQLIGVRNQKKFQEIMGKTEVWGEVFLKLI